METPLPEEACSDRAPPEKLALPLAPRAPFSTDRKVDGVKAAAGPPSALMVPASKSMSTRPCSTPEGLVTAISVLPVKPETAVGRSSPVLRPVS